MLSDCLVVALRLIPSYTRHDWSSLKWFFDLRPQSFEEGQTVTKMIIANMRHSLIQVNYQDEYIEIEKYWEGIIL